MTVPFSTSSAAHLPARGGAGPRIAGLVLAAGAGIRFGGPKALARAADGTPWVVLAARMLRDAGCVDVLVALGASADEAASLVPSAATVVIVEDWAEGLSATLRAGLDAVAGTGVDALVITPVDTPDAPAGAAERVIDAVAGSRTRLARATYDGIPGHPVFVGADHFAALAASLSGDQGAGPYLRAQDALTVECGDLWSGADVDERV